MRKFNLAIVEDEDEPFYITEAFKAFEGFSVFITSTSTLPATQQKSS